MICIYVPCSKYFDLDVMCRLSIHPTNAWAGCVGACSSLSSPLLSSLLSPLTLPLLLLLPSRMALGNFVGWRVEERWLGLVSPTTAVKEQAAERALMRAGDGHVGMFFFFVFFYSGYLSPMQVSPVALGEGGRCSGSGSTTTTKQNITIQLSMR